jgi:hypothetical protein
MGRYTYVVLTRSQPGREAEFLRWYDEQHLGDVARIPGIVAARRFNVVHQKIVNLDAPQWQSLAIYDIEHDDPKSVLSAIYAASGTDAMPSTDAYNRDGLIEIIGLPVDGGRAGNE